MRSGGSLGVGNDPTGTNTTTFLPISFPFDDTGLTPALATRIRTLAEQIDAHRKARQAAHDDVTLTGLYNVLDKLRSGEPLTARERQLHEHGLVAVLKSLHDELDAAVLQAYGWSDLALPADADMLLERLVALNAKRANEEAAGQVRWLRPQLQAPAAGEQAGIELPPAQAAAAPSAVPTAPRPWPTRLPDQIKAIADLLSSQGTPLAVENIASHFTARGRWRERLPTILQTLEALGRARQVDAARWMDAGRR